jgi:hypothetical protein
MVLTPILLVLGLAYPFVGDGSLLGTVVPSTVNILLGVACGYQVYRRWTTLS